MEPLTMLAIGSAIAGGVSSLYNTYSQKQENQIMREREDNAIGRRMRDLEANGLSATLAAGSPASSQAGTAARSEGSAFDYLSKALQLYQGKADISKTNADTALANMQATSEQFKQAFMQAQTQGEELRNSWINADMFSKLDLRDKQGQKIGEELKQIVQNTALLKAKTAYEQANTDFISTQNQNEKIRQDMLINDRSWNEYKNFSQVFNNFSSGNYLKTLFGGSLGLSARLQQFVDRKEWQNQKNKWFYP